MKYIKVKTVEEALATIEQYPNFYKFCGGTDLALKIKADSFIEGIIDISSLHQLAFISKQNSFIRIGALTTINSLLEDNSIQKYLPLLADVSKNFASHQIRNLATLGGNIANNSPLADMIAPLLVLESTVTLLAKGGERTIPLKELFDGFKSLTLKNEIIKCINIPLKNRLYYYRKVGARAKLNISKLSLAMVKSENKFYISGASLNTYTKHFFHLEVLLNSANCDDEKIVEALHKDIALSDSYRSTKAYKQKVLFNMIKEALEKF